MAGTKKPVLSKAAQNIVNFYKSNNLLKMINFTTYGMHISKTSFAKVAKAMEEGRIQIKAVRLAKAGEYRIKENTLVVNVKMLKKPGIPFYGSLVHEGVHAYQDLQATPMSTLGAEYMAYIAQSIYEIKAGAKYPAGHFAHQLHDYYTGKKVNFTGEDLLNAFSQVFEGIMDDHGSALYSANGDYQFDGAPAKKQGKK